MLTDAGRDNGLPLGCFVKLLNEILGTTWPNSTAYQQWVLVPLFFLRHPFLCWLLCSLELFSELGYQLGILWYKTGIKEEK